MSFMEGFASLSYKASCAIDTTKRKQRNELKQAETKLKTVPDWAETPKVEKGAAQP